jgi:hypothetical protein
MMSERCKHEFHGTQFDRPECLHCGISLSEYKNERIEELEGMFAVSRDGHLAANKRNKELEGCCELLNEVCADLPIFTANELPEYMRLMHIKIEELQARLELLDNNTTFYEPNGLNGPALSSVSKRIWYHATDDTESYPFSKVLAVLGEQDDK